MVVQASHTRKVSGPNPLTATKPILSLWRFTMARSRAYNRKMRAKHIKRKKNIVSHYAAFRVLDGYTYYKHDGMFSKGKVHCSCPLCKSKAYYGKHVLTLQELRNLDRSEDDWFDSYNADMVELADTSA